MAYTKNSWNNGDTITKTKLDHIEDGIANAQSTADGAASSVNALSANGAIGTANLANGAVTAAKLGESATDIVADTFGTSTAYSVGDYCIYSGALYRFTADKSAGAWDSTKVVAIALADDVSDLKNAVTTNNNIIYTGKNEVTAKAGHVAKITNGHCNYIVNPSGYWKSFILPVSCLYIDGVATMKSGGLSGNQSQGIPAFAFLDENYDVVGTPVYSSIPAPHTFNASDIPAGAVYVACNYSRVFTFAFQSLDTRLESMADVANANSYPKSTNIDLEFVSASGYYNKNGGFSQYSGVTTASVSVVPGEEYLITSRDYYNCAIVVFFKSDSTFLSGIAPGSGTAAHTDYKITVPANASTMMIQRVYAYRTLLKKVIGVEAMPVTSVLNGKRVTIIGDSITEKNIRAKTNWADYLKDWTGAVVQNLGASGTGFIAGSANPYSNRITNISNPDIIGVALSFNDMSDSITVDDLKTAAGSFFDTLLGTYPAIPIICYVQSPWSAYHYGVEKSDAWVEALKELCWGKGIPFYDDMYHGTTLKPWISANRAVYYMNDGEGSTGEEDWVHPNSEGHKVIARILYQKFEENIVADGLNSRILGE